MSAVQLWPFVSSQIKIGTVSSVVAYGPMLGGFLQNPYTPEDQGLAVAESLFVSLIGEAGLVGNDTTKAIPPGGIISIPAGFAGTVNVNAASAGHRFSGVIFQDPPNFVDSTAEFPPSGPTTLTRTIPSYLYQQYNDDDDLQAFVDAYNSIAQDYVTWFAEIGLPIYTGAQISGALLDWVAAGLYGMTRPRLPSGRVQTLGPLNTYAFNTMVLNLLRLEGPSSFYLTSDDIFKRILTWHLFKGDSKTFNVRWLKRRVMRFLTGIDGTGGEVDQTYQVSVTFGTDHQVNINLQSTRRYARGGAILGAGLMNSFYLNEFVTTSVVVPVSPLVGVFKAAVDAGVLELPFQFTWIVNTN